jgi:hypothetical protein
LDRYDAARYALIASGIINRGKLTERKRTATKCKMQNAKNSTKNNPPKTKTYFQEKKKDTGKSNKGQAIRTTTIQLTKHV